MKIQTVLSPKSKYVILINKGSRCRQTYEKLHKLDYLHREKPIEIRGGWEEGIYLRHTLNFSYYFSFYKILKYGFIQC